MLDIKFIRENVDKVKQGIASKGANPDLVERAVDIDVHRRSLQLKLDEIKAVKNKFSKEVVGLPAGERAARIAELQAEDVKAEGLQDDLKKTEEELKHLLYQIPNLPDEDVPVGPDESGNQVVKTVGEPTSFDFDFVDYMRLSAPMDLVDTERAAKVSGSRFGYLKGAAALLEFALGQHVLRTLTDPQIISKIAESVDPLLSKSTFIPVVPPVMIREETYLKTARMDADARDERYRLEGEDHYLVGSAEHTMVPMHMDETFNETELPRRYIGFSSAFRRESGTYGKDTKGILRVHQFDKWEMEVFVSTGLARREFDFVVACQEYLVNSLGLPYQVVFKCTGDVGGPNARGVDIDVWMPGENKYRETHTADYISDYQARRLNIRVRTGDGKPEFVHTIDATAFAIGRTLIAIMENYQQADGSIKVPDVLKPYLPMDVIRGPWGMSEIK